jgi:pimeloyl-ACP methyl ester carboxylesterase
MTPDWILIRGLIRESGHWGDFPQDVRAHFPHSRIYLVDIPGNGSHWTEPSPWTVAEMAESVRRDYLRQREADSGRAGQPPGSEPGARIFASSLGAMVALHWMAAHPGEIAGAVLTNPSMAGVSRISDRLQKEGRRVLWRLLRARNGSEKEAAILDWVSNDPQARSRVLPLWARLRGERPVSGRNLVRQLVAATRFRLSSPQIGGRCLILCGEGDRVVAPRCSTDLQAYLRCDLKTHPTAGHDLCLDAPEWVLRETAAWVGEASR